eukprot:2306332-Pyramimonas_sp.AAC.1
MHSVSLLRGRQTLCIIGFALLQRGGNGKEEEKDDGEEEEELCLEKEKGERRKRRNGDGGREGTRSRERYDLGREADH